MIEIIVAAALGASSVEPAANSPPGPQLSASDKDCRVDTEAMLRLSPKDFDQGPSGWRALEKKLFCEAAVADLIAQYRRKHWGKLLQHEVHISYWHEGQARALAGQTDDAIKLLLAGVCPCWASSGDYALATVAFLQNDLEALKAARARLAALPRPKLVPPEVEWPENLDEVDRFIACFGKSYLEAYSNNSGKCVPR